MSERKFAFEILLLTLLIISAGYILFLTVLQDYSYRIFPLIPGLFGLTSIGLHSYLIRRSGIRAAKFIPHFMGATGIKLMIYMISMVILVLINRSKAPSILITFIITYLIYTVHEVISVLKYFKKSDKTIKS